MSTTDVVPVVERHTMVFSDVEVEIVIDDNGHVSVDFRQEGEIRCSFSWDNWREVVTFAQAAKEMSA